MDIRNITDGYSVSPQISVEDVPEIRAAGFKTVICNRPDAEVPPSHSAQAIREAVEAAGMTFHELPINHLTLTPDMAVRQAELAQDGPVLAYCASGNRSTILWALGQTGQQPVHDILGAAARAGYDLSGMRPALDSLSAQG